MDNHDIAHYGIGAALAAGIGGVAMLMPASAPKWPALNEAQAENIVSAVADVLPKREFWVYCVDSSCAKISDALMIAGKRLSVSVKYDRLISGSDGVSVGAPTKDVADKIKAAVEEASGGKLKVETVFSPQSAAYVSFGRIETTDK